MFKISYHLLSWTSCYDDNYQIHQDDKNETDWDLRKSRQIFNVLFSYNDDESEYYKGNYDSELESKIIKSYVKVLKIKKFDYISLLINL